MKTAFLGAYGYGNLGDELCLIEAMKHFRSSKTYAFTVDDVWTSRCVEADGVFKTFEELEKLDIERIVFGGGAVGTLPGIDSYTKWMQSLEKRGVACHIHNIGVAKLLDLTWLNEEKREFFRSIPTFSVRDFRSATIVNSWNFGRIPTISHYPERKIDPDFSLADQILPAGKKLLGISMIDMEIMGKCLELDRDRVRNLLSEFKGWTVIPIVSTIHKFAGAASDHRGFNRFAEMFLGDFEIACTQILERDWWYNNLTPRKLKGIIARCGTLISQRKHNCIHGIGSSIRVIGMHPDNDDSIPRTFVSLSNDLVAESRYIGLRQPLS